MNKKYTYLIIIILIVVTFAAFGRIAGNDFINFDDNLYITENNHIKSGINLESIKWAFTAFVSKNWHPLTWISLMLDWILFGANAYGYHLINLVLHIGSVLFLFFFFNRTTKSLWPSAFVAALFSLHPLRVESVAWAAERKDVLSMFFGMASVYAYACYAESSKLSRYFLCLMFFALSLMAKSMLVTLPFILLLLDYWPLGRWQKALSVTVESRFQLAGRLVWEKVPFVFLTIASSVITVWAQYEVGLVRPPFSERVANAIVSYVSYLRMILWPVDLAVFYPFEHFFPLWQILTSCFILIAITLAALYYIKKLPFIFTGWFWYLGTLIPVIGLVPINSPMADRYTYLPSIGIAIIFVWGILLLFQSEDIRKKILFPAVIAYFAIMAVLTWQQCGYWKNSITLFKHTLQVTKDNYLAHNNLGVAMIAEGRSDEAIYHYRKAIHIAPNLAEVFNNRGVVNNNNLGQYQMAVEYYDEAIRLKPDYIDAYNNRGSAYAMLGQHQHAVKDFNEVIRLNPDYADAYNNRGVAYAILGQYQHAIKDFDKAIHLKQDYVDAYNNRGFVYDELGQYQLAIEDYKKAIRLKPDYAPAYYNQGNAYLALGRYQQAIENYDQAIRLESDYVDARKNRAIAYFVKGNNELGCRDVQKVCELGDCKFLEIAKGEGNCR